MPLRPDKDHLVPLASGWRRGFQRTSLSLEDYVDLGDLEDGA
jgi:hypothetical protein